MSSQAPVPRSLRALNLVALVLFLAGAGLHARAWLGLERLRSSQPGGGEAAFSGMARFDHLWRLSEIGQWLIVAAIAVAVVAAAAAVVVRRN